MSFEAVISNSSDKITVVELIRGDLAMRKIDRFAEYIRQGFNSATKSLNSKSKITENKDKNRVAWLSYSIILVTTALFNLLDNSSKLDSSYDFKLPRKDKEYNSTHLENIPNTQPQDISPYRLPNFKQEESSENIIEDDYQAPKLNREEHKRNYIFLKRPKPEYMVLVFDKPVQINKQVKNKVLKLASKYIKLNRLNIDKNFLVTMPKSNIAKLFLFEQKKSTKLSLSFYACLHEIAFNKKTGEIFSCGLSKNRAISSRKDSPGPGEPINNIKIWLARNGFNFSELELNRTLIKHWTPQDM